VAGQLTAYVAVTDRDWFDTLRAQENPDEVNFWQPSASTAFGALKPGEPLLFKLHSPDNFIVGGGFFAYWTKLPVSLAWEAFGTKNGAANVTEMRTRVERYRRVKPSPNEDYEIGCVLLEQAFFFDREHWLAVPDWQRNIVRGKGYDLTVEPGKGLWMSILALLRTRDGETLKDAELVATSANRFGKPALLQPRLGQGSFRVMVTDAYSRRCAASGERVLPVLEAAHIRPYAAGGEHRVDNGLLLRSDLHTLFDHGYLTVTPDHRIEVSRRLKSEFDNGKEYFAFHGRAISVPSKAAQRPSAEFLTWHNENQFLG
jgi:putative restriction endonuclease